MTSQYCSHSTLRKHSYSNQRTKEQRASFTLCSDALQLTTGPDRTKMQRIVTSCLELHLSSFHNVTPGSPALGIQDIQEDTPTPPAQVLRHQIWPERNAISFSGSEALECGLSRDCLVLELTDDELRNSSASVIM